MILKFALAIGILGVLGITVFTGSVETTRLTLYEADLERRIGDLEDRLVELDYRWEAETRPDRLMAAWRAVADEQALSTLDRAYEDRQVLSGTEEVRVFLSNLEEIPQRTLSDFGFPYPPPRPLPGELTLVEAMGGELRNR